MAAAERTLIVGIDYSDFCIPALDQALQRVAEFPRTRLVPLLALPEATPSRLAEAEATTDDFVARAQDNLVRLVQKRAQASGVQLGPVLPLVCFGGAAACLIARAKELGAELICVGTHSRRGLNQLLLGSVADEVVRQAPCSVLVARTQPPANRSASEARPRLEEAELSEEEFSLQTLKNAPAAALSAEYGMELASEPHLDAGWVVLHVLDLASGQTFICSFRDFSGVRVEPLEGQWVPQPSAVERARAARFAIAEAGRDAARFSQLFEELTRRRSRERS